MESFSLRTLTDKALSFGRSNSGDVDKTSDLAEQDADPTIPRRKKIHIFWQVVVTLTLAIMGGAQLPLGAAFASTGVLVSTVLVIVVGLANAFTSNMLFFQAYYTGRVDYEQLGQAIGGKFWKFVVELCVFLLLYGVMIAVLQQVGEVWAFGMQMFGSSMPELLTNPKFLMVIATIMCLPFIFLTKLTALEWFANVTFVIVIVSTIWLIVVAFIDGMPYLGVKGEFEWIGFTTIGDICAAASTYGFMFFIQPVAMPMLGEMPPGKEGVVLLSSATQTTILGTAGVTYWLCGFFAAAAFGQQAVETGNWLVNDLGGGVAQAILNIAFTVYLCLSIPPFEFGTRHALDSFILSWFAPENKNKFVAAMRKHYKTRQAILSAFLYLSSLILAVFLPGNSATVITVTGALGVCMVSYVIPVVNHFMLYFGKALCQRNAKVLLDLEEEHAESLRVADILDAYPRSDSYDAEEEEAVLRGRASMGSGYSTSSADSFSSRHRKKAPLFARRSDILAPVVARTSILPAKEDIELAPVPEGEAVTRPGVKPIPGGALDYSYIKGPEDHNWKAVVKEVILPILVLVLGVANAVITLATL